MRDNSPFPKELLQPYAEQLERLLPGAAEVALLAPRGVVYWSSFDASILDERLLKLLRTSIASNSRRARAVDPIKRLAMIPILCDEDPLGAVLVRFVHEAGESTDRAVDRTWRKLRPVLDRLGRQLAQAPERGTKAAPPSEERSQSSGRTEDLEWLFGLVSVRDECANEKRAMERLLAAAVERTGASFGALAIPAENLSLTHTSRAPQEAGSARAYEQAQPFLMTYMQRRGAPLVANRPPARGSGRPTCKILAAPIMLRDDKPIGVIAIYKPVSMPDFGRRELYVARHIARLIESLLAGRYDPATGLLTRASLEQEAKTIIAAHGRGSRHAVVYIDIDHLHVLNESFGFEFGDHAIVRIANLLGVPYLPSNAVCGRIAGDRLLVFLPACDTEQARRCTESIQRAVNKLTVGVPPQRVTLSVTCGIADVRPTTAALVRAMGAAELACRAAKERSRDRCEVYVDIDDSMMHRQGDILGVVRLRSALDKDRLQIFAQKIVSLEDTSRMNGIECLVRLTAEDGSIIPPADLLSAAHRYQLSRAIDEWMIKHAIAALRPWVRALFDEEIYFALNLSEQSLHDDGLLPFVEDQVVGSDIAPWRIMFEIAESTVARNSARAGVMIQRARNLGYRVALDDFGASDDSLVRLESLRPDRIKIDGGIIRGVLASGAAEAAVRTIADLAASLEIEGVAEHVESHAVAEKLRELGVGYAQGSFLHETEPLQALLESLSEDSELERVREMSQINLSDGTSPA